MRNESRHDYKRYRQDVHPQTHQRRHHHHHQYKDRDGETRKRGEMEKEKSSAKRGKDKRKEDDDRRQRRSGCGDGGKEDDGERKKSKWSRSGEKSSSGLKSVSHHDDASSPSLQKGNKTVESGSSITEQVVTRGREEHHQSHLTLPGSEERLFMDKKGEDPELIKTGTSSFPTSSLLLTSCNQNPVASSSLSNLVIPGLSNQRQKQEEKKKLLWGNAAQQKVGHNISYSDNLFSPRSQVKSPWEGLQFSNNNQTEKFRKLMGIKSTTDCSSGNNEETLDKKQEKIFQDLQEQYTMARMATHSQAKGAGLGSFSRH